MEDMMKRAIFAVIGIVVMMASAAFRAQAPSQQQAPIVVEAEANRPDAGIYVMLDGILVQLQEGKGERKGPSLLKGIGLGVATQGISSFRTKKINQVLAGPKAQRRVPATAEFRFYDTELNEVIPGSMPVFFNPSTYTLARMEVGKKERKVGVQRFSLMKSDLGVEDKDAVAVNKPTKRSATGEYPITLKEPLAPGEYAFVPSNGVGPVFDFGVD